jgi:ELP3 family radical SAM enzyme/protein acetyltransferase
MEQGCGITHPILADIEDLQRNIFKKDSITISNPIIIAFVTDLVYDDESTQYDNDSTQKHAESSKLINYVTREDYEKRVVIIRRKHKIQPKKGELNQYYQLMCVNKTIERNRTLEVYLRFKSSRSESGVLIITVLTSPGKFSCPEDCYFCPDERKIENDFTTERVMPRSYLSSEPACRRASENQFDPVLQFFDRAEVLRKIGHMVDKVEIIVLGGTWSFYPTDYQEEFCRDLFYSANMFYDALTGKSLRPRMSLEEEQVINETAPCRVIGITLETRPDHITKTEIKKFRKYGCTRVQLGIQHTNNDILDGVNRGHGVEASVKAVKLLKENGFKVDGHFMPDLPGSNPQMDIEMLREVFTGVDLQVDYAKVYPCTPTDHTVIKKWRDEGTYTPYAELNGGKDLIKVIKTLKTWIPPWIRLNRIYRDFPNHDYKTGEVGAVGGIMTTNLRQIIMNQMKAEGVSCKCIRCREVGIGVFSWDNASVFIRTYNASGGFEYFISVESLDNHILYGFVRLRFNDPLFEKRLSIFDNTVAMIRELHVYGSLVKVNTVRSGDASQHFGIGKCLLAVAEKIAYDAGYSKVSVISGVGVRDYYRKRGYTLTDYGYMMKSLLQDSEQIFELPTIYRLRTDLGDDVDWSLNSEDTSEDTSEVTDDTVSTDDTDTFKFKIEEFSYILTGVILYFLFIYFMNEYIS